MESVVIVQMSWFVSWSALIIGSISYWVSILCSPGLSHLPEFHFVLLCVTLSLFCRHGSPMCVVLVSCTGKGWGQSWIWHLGMLVTPELVVTPADAGNNQEKTEQTPGCCRSAIHPAHILRTIYFVPALGQEVPPSSAQHSSFLGMNPAPQGIASTVWIMCVHSSAVFPSPVTSPHMDLSALATPCIWFQDYSFPPLAIVKTKNFFNR